jgi:hypothetical protein
VPLLFFSAVPPVYAAWWTGFSSSIVRQVSLALPWMQEAILSAETVPWLTIAIQDGSYSGQVCGQGNLSESLSLFASIVLKG